MDYIEISGKTVDDALTEALVKLETTSDKVDVEVVEKGSSGILGLFNKPAVIRVRRKEDKDILEEDVVAEVFHEEAKKEEPAVAPATEKKPEMTREEVESRIRNFLSDLFNAMDMEVAVEITFNDKEECINVELKGGNMGVLIGKRGQTLDSIQYLTSLVVNKGREKYVRIKMDTEDYRNRRKETLESLAKNIPGVKRIRFFMTFGQSYLTHMKCLEDVGMLRTDPIMVDGKEVVPLQVLKELLPDPASLGPRTVGKTNIGCIFNGIKDGKKKSIYIYNVCDHQECYKEVESQAVSYTTGVPAMIGSMMVVTGLWKKPGVFNLEEMDPDPYMEALNKFGLPWKVVENPVSVDCYKTADPSVHMD